MRSPAPSPLPAPPVAAPPFARAAPAPAPPRPPWPRPRSAHRSPLRSRPRRWPRPTSRRCPDLSLVRDVTAVPEIADAIAEAVAEEIEIEAEVEPPPPAPTGIRLGELLVGRGLVSEEQLTDALSQQRASGKRLGNILVELGFLRERVLTDVLAEQLGMAVVDLSRAEIDPEIVALLPEAEARRLGALPTHRDGSRIEVAVADPLTEDLDKLLIEKLGSLVRIKLAVHSDLDQAIDRVYAPSAELGDALRVFEARLEERKAAQAPDTTVLTVVDENAPIVKIVNVILEQAVRDRASDVHIEPIGDSVRVRVRTDGALHQITTLPADGPVAREPHQGHVRHEHRRAPPSPGRADGGDDREP